MAVNVAMRRFSIMTLKTLQTLHRLGFLGIALTFTEPGPDSCPDHRTRWRVAPARLGGQHVSSFEANAGRAGTARDR